MDMLGQLGRGLCQANTVLADVCYFAQSVQQAECLKNSAVDTDADAGISFFDLLQGRAGGESPLRHNRHGKMATAASIAQISAQLTQGALYGG